MSKNYNHAAFELKWQTKWDEIKAFEARVDHSKPKYYALEMFPYPSGKIHMGHIRNYTIGDVIARFKMAQGYNVLHPMGWDAFGLPAENAAIKNKTAPAAWTTENIRAMRNQLKAVGFSYDWNREIDTSKPDYYVHSQSLFIDFFNAGFAYQKEAMVNWDPVDNTVLATEQIIEGRGWRSGAIVEKKLLKQWFLKITDFVDELLEGLNGLDGWPDKVRLMQKNWIGKAEGAKIKFGIQNSVDTIEIFTTRPETIFGVSFIAVAFDHPFINKLPKNAALESFIAECKQGGTAEENIEKAEKKGFNTGFFAIHPLDKNIIVPIFIANFVLSEYGTGAVFGCPGHDSRDHAFAIKYNLEIKQVISDNDQEAFDITTAPFLGDGIVINSSFLNGFNVDKAREVIIQRLEKENVGQKKTNYRLRDWGIARQRYWGCPIPMVYCNSCGVVPVNKKDLPIMLPEDISFDKSGNPLQQHPTWKHTTCPRCDKSATREVDTFDTFFESSWYFLRFTAPFSTQPIDLEQAKYWMPVDQYVGGAEHTVLHLLYSRFFMKVLNRLGYCEYTEPFTNLLNQGMICHETYKDADDNWLYPQEVRKESGKAYHVQTGGEVRLGRIEKMSKSKCNIVEPEAILKKYGADTVRLFLLSDSPPDRDLEWTDEGVEGAYRYLLKLWKMVDSLPSLSNATPDTEKQDHIVTKGIHKTIYEVRALMEELAFNKVIAKVREFTNLISATLPSRPVMHHALSVISQLLNPLIPHITEELWERLGYKEMLVKTEWPKEEQSYLTEDEVTVAVQINGKLKSTINVRKDANQEEVMSSLKELDSTKKFLDGKIIEKVIYVPNRIINLVYRP